MNKALASDISTLDWLTSFNHWGSIGFVFGLLIQIIVVFRVIMGKRGVGETLAWVMLILGIPVVGWIMYLLIGELRLGASREKRYQKLSNAVQRRLQALEPIESQVPWSSIDREYFQIAKTGRGTLNFPILPGNQLELFEDWQQVFDQIIADIDSATTNCDLQFYIWHSGGRTQDVVSAIERARSRGVQCRILVDSLGSWNFLHSDEAKQLAAAGAEVREALPSRLWRLPFVRYDLRMHRKLVLIDDQIAWTGSLNLIDPRFFKREAGVGQWVDAMVRVRGPIVEGLAIVFQTDWQTEDEQGSEDVDCLPDLTEGGPPAPVGSSVVQVLPSGPAFAVDAIEQILLTAVYSARRELIITSPYFVPSESLTLALASAAQRGVAVTVIVPAKVDSKLVRFASRALRDQLLAAGVRLIFFHEGLLHTKSLTIDGTTSLFGTLNMDPRSLRLNFEVTLAIYDPKFTAQLRALQQRYIAQGQELNMTQWQNRGLHMRILENLAKLLSPLL